VVLSCGPSADEETIMCRSRKQVACRSKKRHANQENKRRVGQKRNKRRVGHRRHVGLRRGEGNKKKKECSSHLLLFRPFAV
jgi:hypothetical protein